MRDRVEVSLSELKKNWFCFVCWICTLPQEINLYIVINGMAAGTKSYLLILGISVRIQKNAI